MEGSLLPKGKSDDVTVTTVSDCCSALVISDVILGVGVTRVSKNDKLVIVTVGAEAISESTVKNVVPVTEGSIGGVGDIIGSKLLSVITFISLLVELLVMDTTSNDGELDGVSVNNIEVSKTESVDATGGRRGVTVKLLIKVVDVMLTLLMLSTMEVSNDTSNVSFISKLPCILLETDCSTLVSTSDVADVGVTALDKLSIVITSVNTVIG